MFTREEYKMYVEEHYENTDTFDQQGINIDEHMFQYDVHDIEMCIWRCW